MKIIAKFISETLLSADGNRVPCKSVFAAYKLFCQKELSKPLKYKDFRQELEKHEFSCVKLGNVFYVENVAFQHNTKDLINLTKAWYGIKD